MKTQTAERYRSYKRHNKRNNKRIFNMGLLRRIEITEAALRKVLDILGAHGFVYTVKSRSRKSESVYIYVDDPAKKLTRVLIRISMHDSLRYHEHVIINIIQSKYDVESILIDDIPLFLNSYFNITSLETANG